MEFYISEFSLDYDDNGEAYSPHPKAIQKSFDRIEGRTCTEESFDKRFGGNEGTWRSKGINHTTTDGGRYIKRTHPGDIKRWVIEIENLEDLLRLIDEEPISLSYGDDQPTIHIPNKYK